MAEVEADCGEMEEDPGSLMPEGGAVEEGPGELIAEGGAVAEPRGLPMSAENYETEDGVMDDEVQVGSVLASSYAERVNSAANLILNKDTLLAEEEINMCTVLRMNRGFMEFMRKYHPDAANQHFKMTVNSGE